MMRKKAISLLVVMSAALQFFLPVSGAEAPIIVQISNDEPGKVTIEADIGTKGEAVTVAVFNPGKSIADASCVSSQNYTDVFVYNDIVLSDATGNLCVSAEGDFENHEKYTVYLRTADGREYSDEFSYYNDDERLTYISYKENSVILEGTKNGCAHIVILNPGYSADDYKNNIGGAVLCDRKVEAPDGEYKTEVSGIDFSKGDYKLCVDGESYTLRKPVDFYVSPAGSNLNDGSIEKPFLTIAGARNYLRKNPQNAPVNVILSGGEYLVTSVTAFSDADSGTVEFPVVYKVREGETAELSGAKKLKADDFAPVTDKDILDRMYPGMEGKVYQLDLSKYYIQKSLYDFGAAFDDEDEAGMEATPLGFYLNGNKQSIARYPNVGYESFGDSVVKNGGERDGNGTKGGGIFKTLCAERWAQADDMFIEGFFRYTWHKEWAKVGTVDAADNTLSLKSWTMYGIYPQGRWAAVNLLEEIDIPGEWFVDKDTATLYYYPPHKLTSADDFELSVLCNDIISINGASNIRFEGITLRNNAYLGEKSKNAKAYYNLNNQSLYADGITVGGGSSHVRISGCTFENLVGRGVGIIDNSASYVTIDGCVFRNCETACRMDGGDAVTFERNYNVLKNSDLSDLYNGVHLNGFGNVVKNNVIHNVSQNGIVYAGNENIIKYNEFYNVSNRYADGGAVYAGRSWAKYANRINNNLFHNIGPFDAMGKEVWIVYWDDMLGGSVMKNNIVVGNGRSDVRGVQVAQGPDNVIEGNTFVDFPKSAVDMSYRSAEGANPNIAQCRNTINSYTQGQIARWGLEKLMQIDAGNVLTWASYRENLTIRNNVYSDCAEFYLDDPSGYSAGTWKKIRGKAEAQVTLENNSEADVSVYVNPQSYDYRIKDEYAKNYPENCLNESNFSMDSVGIQGKVLADAEYAGFGLLYPSKNLSGVDKNNVTLVWEKSEFSDYYKYEVAKDAQFAEIVCGGTTIDTVAEISLTGNDGLYYWRVTAVNNSRQSPYQRVSETAMFATGNSPIGPQFGGTVFERNGKTIIIDEALKNDVIAIKEKISGGNGGEYCVSYALAFYNGKRLVYVKTAEQVFDEKDTLKKVMEFNMPKEEFDKVSLIRLRDFGTMAPYGENYLYEKNK